MNQYLDELNNINLNENLKKDWWSLLKTKTVKNKSVIQSMANDLTLPLNYYAAYSQVNNK